VIRGCALRHRTILCSNSLWGTLCHTADTAALARITFLMASTRIAWRVEGGFGSATPLCRHEQADDGI
jgi:hypothetical protein